MATIDAILNALENKTRREIIRRLIYGDEYPLQLSRGLRISQQAVMKHLYILEKNNIVKLIGFEKSDQGPNRKIYKLDESFLLTVSLTPYFFDIREKSIDYNKKINIEGGDLIEELKKVENEIDKLENELVEKLKKKNAIMEKIDEMFSAHFQSDLERDIFYSYISSWDENYVSSEIGLHPSVVKNIVERILNEYI